MDELLPHYEREVTLSRRAMQEFATRYPKIAARLAISGEHSEDPHVERLLQSFALLCARLDAKLEDDYPEFTEAMLEVLFPHYLRAFPSCSIAQFHGKAGTGQTEPRVVPRGTQVVAPVGRQVFRTADDVTLVPLAISSVRYTTSALAPMGAALPPDTTGLLTLTFDLTSPSATFAIVPDALRLHLSGAREIVAALADAALLNATRAYVEADGTGSWKRLPEVPLAAAGLDDTDALVAMPVDDTLKPFHLLMEYGAFPPRFDFLDLNTVLCKRAVGPARRIALHLAMTGVHPDSHRAQRLSAASTSNVRLFCTPVVNLFAGAADPVETRAGLSYYPVRPLSEKTAVATDIWSVDQVRQTTGQGTSILPRITSLEHGAGASPVLFWTLLRDAARRAPKMSDGTLRPEHSSQPSPGGGSNHADAKRGVELAFVGTDGAPADPGRRQLAITLSCTNGDLSGIRERELTLHDGDPTGPITLLSPPGASRRPAFRRGELWELLSWLTPQTVRLNAGGIDPFRRLCTRFAASSGDAGRRFDALCSLSTTRVRRWMPGKPASAFVAGLEIRLTVDESRFAGFSLSVLGRVMDRFFAPSVPATSFVQVSLICANTGATLRHGLPCQGAQPLI